MPYFSFTCQKLSTLPSAVFLSKKICIMSQTPSSQSCQLGILATSNMKHIMINVKQTLLCDGHRRPSSLPLYVAGFVSGLNKWLTNYHTYTH